MNEILILCENIRLYYPITHAVIKKFYDNKKIIILSFKNIEKYLNLNKDSCIKIFFYIYIDWDFGLKLLNFLKNTYKKHKPNIFIFTDDFWQTGGNKNYLNSIFTTNNYYKVIVQAPNVDILFQYSKSEKNTYYQLYHNNVHNIIFNSFWCCFDNSYISENNNVINKLLISGRIWQTIYEERFQLSKIQGTEILNYSEQDSILLNLENLENIYTHKHTNYSLELNKYIACFSGSVYRTHCILLKTFEILSVGSLLVMPLHEKEYIEKIGLINKTNCWLIDFQKNLEEQVSEILNLNNRYLVDVIRRNGHNHAKEKLNSAEKWKEILNFS